MKLCKVYIKEPFPFLVNNTTFLSDNPLTASISELSSGNASKYGFLTGKDVLREKELIEIAATIKRFEYPPFGGELKKQISLAEKPYQGFDDVKELTPKDDKEATTKKYNRSNLIYN